MNSHSYICLKLTFCSPKILSIINVERQCPALISMSAIQETSLCRGALIEINKNNRVTSFPQGTSSFFRLMIFNLIEWAAQTLLFACNPKQCRHWQIKIPSPQNKSSEKIYWPKQLHNTCKQCNFGSAENAKTRQTQCINSRKKYEHHVVSSNYFSMWIASRW